MSKVRPRSILALDLGAKTGFCELQDGEAVKHGVWRFGGTRPERLLALRKALQPIFSRNWPERQVDAVVYERPFCRGLHATRSLWGMAGVVEAVACGSAAVLDVNIKTIKKWAGPAGKSNKSATLDKCVELGIIPLDDNHADAVCLAFYALEHMEIAK